MSETEEALYRNLSTIAEYADGMTYRIMKRLHAKPALSIDGPIPKKKCLSFLRNSLERYQDFTPKLTQAVNSLSQCGDVGQILASMELIEDNLIEMAAIAANFHESIFPESYRDLMIVGRGIFAKPVNDTLFFSRELDRPWPTKRQQEDIPAYHRRLWFWKSKLIKRWPR